MIPSASRAPIFGSKRDYPCCDSIQAGIACPGVVIENGNICGRDDDLFSGLCVGAFQGSRHSCDPAEQDPPWTMSDHGFWIRDAWLERPNDRDHHGPRLLHAPVLSRLLRRSLLWYHPDTVDVYIGGQTDVRIQWEQNGPGYPGPNVEVADEKGWISKTTLYLQDTGCLTCPWHIQTDHIFIAVPEGTPVGTLSTLTIAGTNDSFVLRAVPPIAVEKQTWGTVKSLFK